MKLLYTSFIDLPDKATIENHMYLRMFLVSRQYLFRAIPFKDRKPFYQVFFDSIGEYRRLKDLINGDIRFTQMDARIGDCKID